MHPNLQYPARFVAIRNSTRSCSQGLDVRNSSPSNAQGEVFFLDIPFYRTRPIDIPENGPLEERKNTVPGPEEAHGLREKNPPDVLGAGSQS